MQARCGNKAATAKATTTAVTASVNNNAITLHRYGGELSNSGGVNQLQLHPIVGAFGVTCGPRIYPPALFADSSLFLTYHGHLEAEARSSPTFVQRLLYTCMLLFIGEKLTGVPWVQSKF